MKAAFLVPTHGRPTLLRACVEHLVRQEVPTGWELDVVVIAEEHDPGLAELDEIEPNGVGLHALISDVPTVGIKLNYGLYGYDHDLVMPCGDDDLSSPHRLLESVRAFGDGAKVCSANTVCAYDFTTGRAARWTTDGLAKGMLGGLAAYDARWLRHRGGWHGVGACIDHSMASELNRDGIAVWPLPDHIGWETVALHHGQNITHMMQFPDPGERSHFREIAMKGIEVAALPEAAQQVIRRFEGRMPVGWPPERDL